MNVSPRTYRTTPVKKKRSKCSYCNWAYAGLSLIYMVTCLGMVVFMHYNTMQNEETFDGILSNWDQPMIGEIKISKSSYSCPKTHPIILSKYHFPGTIEGCACDNGGYDVHKCCFTGMCSENETCHGTDVAPVQEKDLIVWKVENEKFILCGKAISEFKMDEYNSYMNDEGECKDVTKYKLCQTEDKDINKNICVLKTEECPIRSIKFQQKKNLSKMVSQIEGENNNDIDESEEIQQEGTLSITDNIELIFSRDSNMYPAVQFMIDDGFGVCMNPTYRYLGVRKDYMLTDTKRQIQTCTVDTDWQVIDAITQLELYQINDNFQKNVAHLPEFTVSDYYKQQLIYKGYNPITIQCRKYFDDSVKRGENFTQIQKEFQAVLDTSNELFLIIGLLIIYFGCFEVFLSISYRPKTHYGLVFYNKMKSQKLFSGVKFVGLLFKLGVGLAFVIKTFMLNKDALDIRSAAGQYIDENCFDENINNYLIRVQNVLRGSYFTFMLVGSIFIAIFEPNVTYWMRRKMMGRLISDEEDSDEYILPEDDDKDDDYRLQKKRTVSYVEMRNTKSIVNEEKILEQRIITSDDYKNNEGYKQPQLNINKYKSTDHIKNNTSGLSEDSRNSASPRVYKSSQDIKQN